MGRTSVYHERQLGSLCAVHCLNNLLQGPRFGPGDLAEIGVRLDRKERQLLDDDPSVDADGTGSYNVDSSADGGNFSLQVLRVALARLGLRLVPADHPDGRHLMRSEPSRAADGYVVQRRNHWLALRSVGPGWWDLDSLRERPGPLNETELSDKLASLRAGRHPIFLVLGRTLPRPKLPRKGEMDSNWHDAIALLSPSCGSNSSLSSSTRASSGAGRSATGDDGAAGDDKELPDGLDAFSPEEQHAALALAGGSRPDAAEILHKAYRAVDPRLREDHEKLAEALGAGVDALLQARCSLPEKVAQLVVTLCLPSPGVLERAASLVDFGELAHRLLEALARKACGWLWTEGLERAATIAVDRLLAVPCGCFVDRERAADEGGAAAAEVLAGEGAAGSKAADADRAAAAAFAADLAAAAAFEADLAAATAADDAAGGADVARGLAAATADVGAVAAQDAGGVHLSSPNQVFEALDALLAGGAVEGRPCCDAQPFVSLSGLQKVSAEALGPPATPAVGRMLVLSEEAGLMMRPHEWATPAVCEMLVPSA